MAPLAPTARLDPHPPSRLRSCPSRPGHHAGL